MKLHIDPPTIRNLIQNSITEYAELPALAAVDQTPITYAQLSASINVLGKDLLDRGVKRGDRIAILGDNCPDWVIAYLTITSLGAVAVPILPGFPEADVRHILRDSGARMIFIGDKQRDMVTEIKELEIRPLKSQNVEITSAAQIMAGIDAPAPTDLAVIIYTSGTTGHSKGVMLTHNNIVQDVMLGIERFPIDKNDRFLSILPLSHTFEATGGMLCPLAVGILITYIEGLPTPQKLLSSMQSVKPTGVLTVPLVMDKIYRKRVLPEVQKKKLLSLMYKLPAGRRLINRKAGAKLHETFGGALRFFMFGGAALNEDVEQFLRDAGISYATGYGMTETSPIITINPFGKVKVGSCGQPIPGIEVKIHEPDPKSGVGEILVRGPIVMQGYYNNPEATKQTFLEDGWLRTGDLGIFDDENYLFIKGRSKNLILGPSGENIYPEIVEQVFMQNAFIQEIVVYQEDERVVAKVYPNYDQFDEVFAGQNLNQTQKQQRITETLENVRKEMNVTLPYFSRIQKMIEYPQPFEKTPTNKVKRYLYIPKS